MNIQDAKQEIKNALRTYFRRDEAGRYVFPAACQRPLLLMGPPGIGKTAVVAQAAAEAGVGLVSYTMTHHTRQSAIGLPHIETRDYQGTSVSVTSYTLSEIVASVYDCMERTGAGRICRSCCAAMRAWTSPLRRRRSPNISATRILPEALRAISGFMRNTEPLTAFQRFWTVQLTPLPIPPWGGKPLSMNALP